MKKVKNNDEISWMIGAQPLAFYNEDQLIVYYKSAFYSMDLQKHTRSLIARFEQSRSDSLKESSNLGVRLFRGGIRCCCIRDNTLFFFKNKQLWKLDIIEKRIDMIYQLPQVQSMPLNICESNDKSFQIYWGEYFSNNSRDEVCIWGYSSECGVQSVYNFPQGSIRHIHNIVPEKKGGYYIFTGDNDVAAGIYHASSKFKNIHPLHTGNSTARAVVGFETGQGILYATDYVSSTNHIFLIEHPKDGGCVEQKEICKINGSCIYGVEIKDGFLFSTTVESSENIKNPILSMLSCKPAKGILSRNVDIVFVDRNYNVKVVASFKKDSLPYKLFQYGAVRFAYEQKKSDNVVIYPMSVKKYSGRLGVFFRK